jgi:hypothetical protein
VSFGVGSELQAGLPPLDTFNDADFQQIGGEYLAITIIVGHYLRRFILRSFMETTSLVLGDVRAIRCVDRRMSEHIDDVACLT